MPNEIRQNFAVIIIGGGPAGVSAAMGFLEARIDCLLIDQEAALGGQVPDIPSEILNLPAGLFKSGKDLALSMQHALARAQDLAAVDNHYRAGANTLGNGTSLQGALLKIEQKCRVLSIEPGESRVIVITDKDTYTADYLIVASGYRVKRLEAPGGDRFIKHWHCDTDSLPPLLSQLTLAMVGAGDSALLKTLGLASQARFVHLIMRNKTAKGRPDLWQQVKGLTNCQIHRGFEVVGLKGGKSLEKLVLQSTGNGSQKEIDASEVIVKVGYEPNTEILQGKVQLSANRHVPVTASMTTSHQRIYAAGDIVSAVHPRIASAMGQGMMASGAIIEKVFAARNAGFITEEHAP
jgi:thioredoxin reductase (NADPH)